MNQNYFQNKIVLITGGTGNLGQTVSLEFLKLGATVVITYVNENELSELQSKLGDLQLKVTLVKVNLSKEEEIEKLVSSIIDTKSRIDVLINMVGGYRAGKPVIEIDEKDWDFMMNLNLKTAFLISKHVARQMMTQKNGKIIHVAARSGLKGLGNDSAYAVSKSGVIRLVESLSEEVKDMGINVNCVLPSIIDTQANRNAMPKEDFSKWVKPSDISNIMIFLASYNSNSINGIALPVYGLI